MFQTCINNQQVVIRFPLSYQTRNEIKEEEIIQCILGMDELLLSYINDCFALKSKNNELIIVYVQGGEVLDIQIQQVILKENILFD
jgi:hypothetical protein